MARGAKDLKITFLRSILMISKNPKLNPFLYQQFFALLTQPVREEWMLQGSYSFHDTCMCSEYLIIGS